MRYGFAYGTPEFDEAAMREFKRCIYEDPWHYAKTIFFRLPDIFLPGLQWIFYAESPYAYCASAYEKIMHICSSFDQINVFFLRHVYMRLYMLFAWFGVLLLWCRKQYRAFWLIISCLLAGLVVLPSHIEYRYLVPFYWVLSFAIGYIFYLIWGMLKAGDE